MAVTNLTFSKDGDYYVSSFTSAGECVVQIEKDPKAQVSVYANIGGMKPVLLHSIPNPLSDSIIFKLNIASGIDVMIKATAEVTNAKMLTND